MLPRTPALKSEESAIKYSVNESLDLSDLFVERNLWQIFRQGRPFYRNRFNRIVVICGATLLSGFAALHFARPGIPPNAIADLRAVFSLWTTAGLSFAATILGFLLAGFA